jgi:hypothetical protein
MIWSSCQTCLPGKKLLALRSVEMLIPHGGRAGGHL